MNFVDKALALVGIRDSAFENRLRRKNPVALAFVKGVRAGAVIGTIGVLVRLGNPAGF